MPTGRPPAREAQATISLNRDFLYGESDADATQNVTAKNARPHSEIYRALNTA
jgi:hypothetical protein